MKMRIPKGDPPEVEARPDGRIRQVRHYKLLAPLFGGGVEKNKADPITIVRGTEVRGQLRFWWRATRGGQFDGSLEKMRTKEEAIWGSAAAKDKPGPSKISVSVQCIAEGTLDSPFEVVANKRGRPSIRPRKTSSVPPYAAFPLQPERENASIGMETDTVRTGVEFALEISYPQDLDQDVQAALWAWETFGGLGARTRRGFGALQLIAIDDAPSSTLAIERVETDLHNKLRQHVVPGKWHPDVPHLSHDLRMRVILSKSRNSSPIRVWHNLIQHLQNFRQKRHKRMGLSLWPEANEIRYRLGRNPKWPPGSNSPRLVHKFPRAAFGLPIIFHLPHDKTLPTNSFTLQGKPDPVRTLEKTFERLSSSLILKPFPCSDGQAVGIAVILEAPPEPPHGLEIKELTQDKDSVKWRLDSEEARSEPIRRILHGNPDVVEAFLKSLDSLTRK